MLYLLDANVLIAANGLHYPVEQIPQFWNWLADELKSGEVKMPREIRQEIDPNDVAFANWISKHESDLVLDEEVDDVLLNKVREQAYRCGRQEPLNENEIDKISADSMLISHALKSNNRMIVTRETKDPNKKYSNTKIPNACERMKVKWVNDFRFFFRERNFRIPA